MISFVVATISLLSFSCLAVTTSFASATKKISEEVFERDQVEKVGFKFSASFYTLHSKTFSHQTFVTKSKDGEMRLNVEWSKVFELKDEIRDKDLLSKAESLLRSQVRDDVRLAEKLLVSVEFLGNIIPVYKYLINHDSDIVDCLAAYISVSIPQSGLSNVQGAILRLVELGSHEALKRKIMSIRDGVFGFKVDYKEYERLLKLYHLTEDDLL